MLDILETGWIAGTIILLQTLKVTISVRLLQGKPI